MNSLVVKKRMFTGALYSVGTGDWPSELAIGSEDFWSGIQFRAFGGRNRCTFEDWVVCP